MTNEKQIQFLTELEEEGQQCAYAVIDTLRRVNEMVAKIHNQRCSLELQRTENEHYLANVGL